MKVGDKKQAIGLGVVAVFALGMLGKTAFGSFAKTAGSDAMIVRNEGGHQRSASDSVSEPEQESPKDSQSNPTVTSTEQEPAAPQTTITRNAFDKPDMPKDTKSFGSDEVQRPESKETYRPTRRAPELPPLDPGNGKIENPADVSKPEEKTSSKPSTTKNVKSTIVRYDGFVDVGSPMGIISMNSVSKSVAKGDSIGQGYVVESISNEKIIVRKGNVMKTIFIGQETNI